MTDRDLDPGDADHQTDEQQAADHEAADRGAADDGTADQEAADHGAADHGAAEEEAVGQRGTTGRAADDRAADHGAADHGAADQEAAEEEAVGQRGTTGRAADDRAADHGAADQEAADHGAADQEATEEEAAGQRGTTGRAADDRAADEELRASGEPAAAQAELRRARALARALSRGSADEALPEDALATAALLRHGAGHDRLSDERHDAILREVLEAADRAAAQRGAAEPGPRSWWRRLGAWRWLVVSAPAVAAALLLLVLRPPAAPSPTALPAPDPQLVSTQLARLTAPEGSEQAFEAHMRSYRGQVYAALTERYRRR